MAVINSGLHGCDALILTDDPDRAVRVVPLPTVTESTVAQQAAALREELEDGQDISDVLRWAWEHVAQPVLSALGHTEPQPLDRRPRLWWCVTGPFAFLPLHAAGLHSREETSRAPGRTVMDRVVSSYTPTVRALGHMKRSGPTPPDGPRGALIVAMPQTPGETPLHGVEKEVKAIADTVPDTEVLTGAQATREAVLTALPGHAVVHFACHGVSDAGDPSASRLLLDDHRTAPLDVAAVSRLDLAHAELAYLSACSTTETTARFTDESVHITSAFLLAGFIGVVGTLWPVQDSAARRIAAAFYQEACAVTATTRPVDRAAHALHHAIDRMRAQRPGASALWSAHIHVGA
ncbi:CHAT domain-containing protein [Streptomyces cahuitamycinicus]|uniref:CHAT domain-containing protein n=1 Tax=Streptomyces cahuitamycinicus TaxID=2070367 RepID=UPI0015E12B8C|nr:CHAT domain-containing protein [Streptomyces cahuitamycinicus]